MTNASFFVKIFSIPDEELFSETYVGCTALYEGHLESPALSPI